MADGMTQTDLPLSSDSATDRVARLFAHHLGLWLSIPQIMLSGGLGAWRTEISRCRKQYGMDFANRITRGPSGKVLSSEYRCVNLGTWPDKAGRRAA